MIDHITNFLATSFTLVNSFLGQEPEFYYGFKKYSESPVIVERDSAFLSNYLLAVVGTSRRDEEAKGFLRLEETYPYRHPSNINGAIALFGLSDKFASLNDLTSTNGVMIILEGFESNENCVSVGLNSTKPIASGNSNLFQSFVIELEPAAFASVNQTGCLAIERPMQDGPV